MHSDAVISNEEFDKISDVKGYINKIDKDWKDKKETPFIRELLGNELSGKLTRHIEFYKQQYGSAVLVEMFVTNKYGVVIASTGRTSDFLQADEAWYQKATKEKGFWLGDVEYEEVIRKTIGEDIKKMGHDVMLAESGEQAVKLIEETPFDLVITDLMMEGISGMEVLKEAKRISPGTMVIILTGFGSLDTAIDGIREDVDDYILKLCKSKDFRFRVTRCLERLDFQRKIKVYEDILPVCCVCKKIRDDEGKEHGTGEWLPWENYMRRKAKIEVSHGYCSECADNVLKDAGIPQDVKK